MKNSIRVSFSVLLALPIAGTAEVRTLVIGEGGVDWAESIEQTLGLDRGLAADGLQPVELDPSVNINVGPLTESGQFTNIFGGVWGISANAPDVLGTDGTPFMYGSRGRRQVVDGDIDLASDSEPIAHYTMDFGFPLPINRITFFPPATGRLTLKGYYGLLLKDQYPRQYMLSASLNDQEYLFTPPWTTDLDNVLERKLNQSERVADVRFPTQFMRFARVRFPLKGFIAEIEAYGEGISYVGVNRNRQEEQEQSLEA